MALLALIVVIALIARSMSTKRLAAADARARGREAFAEGMALHDAAAMLPRSTEADPARISTEVMATLDRVASGFETLAADPALVEVSAEVGDVRLALEELRGALLAQAAASAIDPELLGTRLSELDAALQAFRHRLDPAGPPTEGP